METVQRIKKIIGKFNFRTLGMYTCTQGSVRGISKKLPRDQIFKLNNALAHSSLFNIRLGAISPRHTC